MFLKGPTASRWDQLAFSAVSVIHLGPYLKVLFSLGGVSECEAERTGGECISKRSSHLSAQAANSWCRRCKMAEQRMTRCMMTGNRFPTLLILLQEKTLTMLWCLAVSRCWLPSPPHSSRLLSCSFPLFLLSALVLQHSDYILLFFMRWFSLVFPDLSLKDCSVCYLAAWFVHLHFCSAQW